jgi:hypothetical protein
MSEARAAAAREEKGFPNGLSADAADVPAPPANGAASGIADSKMPAASPEKTGQTENEKGGKSR